MRPYKVTPSILAVGGHLKNTIAIARQNQVFLSQHIGDLATPAAFSAFQEVMTSLETLYEFKPDIIACDAHPDYISSQFAQSQDLPILKVQHHYAHILACMAEHQLKAPVLGIAWDGTGYGDDNTIWGGEFIYITPQDYQRVAHFRPWRLPGGEKAVKEPRRIALGLLEELGLQGIIDHAFTPEELKGIKTLLKRNFNTPLTSSVGRLFDGVASLLNVRHKASFEGQAAMELEYIIEDSCTDEYYPVEIGSLTPIIIDWSKLIQGILTDASGNVPLSTISVKFHNSLVEIIVKIAEQIGENQIVLTGGCFQNRYLIERTIKKLQAANFHPYWHQRIPPNDGGICLGQVIAVLRQKN